MSEETVKAVAEATKESMKFGSKLVDGLVSVGGFFKGSITEISGAWEDKLKVWRYERRVRLVKRVQDFLEDEGVTDTKELPPSFVVPLLERGEIQENDDLQDLFARLLANAANPSVSIEPRVAYAEMLSQMTAIDAQNLGTLVEAQMKHRGQSPTALLSTFNLPATSEASDEASDYDTVTETTMAVSVSNLARLGLVEPASSTFGGRPVYKYVSITPLGIDFYWACTKHPMRYAHSA